MRKYLLSWLLGISLLVLGLYVKGWYNAINDYYSEFGSSNSSEHQNPAEWPGKPCTIIALSRPGVRRPSPGTPAASFGEAKRAGVADGSAGAAGDGRPRVVYPRHPDVRSVPRSREQPLSALGRLVSPPVPPSHPRRLFSSVPPKALNRKPARLLLYTRGRGLAGGLFRAPLAAPRRGAAAVGPNHASLVMTKSSRAPCRTNCRPISGKRSSKQMSTLKGSSRLDAEG